MAIYTKKFTVFSALILMALSLVSCADRNVNNSSGTLELSLIDASGDYTEVVITIIEVQVNHEINGWQTLTGAELNLPLTVNLLDLVNGTMAYLGATEVEAGHYTQMRLILDSSSGANYIVDDGVTSPLKIPSGFNTGVKLVNGFNITAAGSTELILDFDVKKSIVKAGNSGQYLLKPTVKVVDTVTNSVSGNVGVTEGNLPEGVNVTAQKYSGEGSLLNEADRVIVAASSGLDEFGNFSMYLPILLPNDPPYNIVAFVEGYLPDCEPLPADIDGYNIPGEHQVLLTLAPVVTESGTISASVEGLGLEESVTISIRQEYDGACGLIEVTSFNLGNTAATDLITLPVGDYQIVVSSENGTTIQDYGITLTATGSLIEVP
ncbi:MAG: DUF4382 domain-containing protein [Acidobacteriota bacterium]